LISKGLGAMCIVHQGAAERVAGRSLRVGVDVERGSATATIIISTGPGLHARNGRSTGKGFGRLRGVCVVR
jgi:hypothetical protein